MNIKKAWFFIIDFLAAVMLWCYSTISAGHCNAYAPTQEWIGKGCEKYPFMAFGIWFLFTIILATTYSLFTNNLQNTKPGLWLQINQTVFFVLKVVFSVLTIALFLYIVSITVQAYAK